MLTGISIGNVAAGALSYLKWGSVMWAVIHAIPSWIYVVYHLVKYGWPS